MPDSCTLNWVEQLLLGDYGSQKSRICQNNYLKVINKTLLESAPVSGKVLFLSICLRQNEQAGPTILLLVFAGFCGMWASSLTLYVSNVRLRFWPNSRRSATFGVAEFSPNSLYQTFQPSPQHCGPTSAQSQRHQRAAHNCTGVCRRHTEAFVSKLNAIVVPSPFSKPTLKSRRVRQE